MATSTYTPIASTILTTAASSYTFSSIPSTYTDLVLVMSGFSVSDAQNYQCRFNGDSATNYSNVTFFADGGGTYCYANATQSYIEFSGNSDSTNADINIINFPNYSNTTTYKNLLGQWNDVTRNTGLSTGLWRSTAAINSIQIFIVTGTINLGNGTTLSLYGIKGY